MTLDPDVRAQLIETAMDAVIAVEARAVLAGEEEAGPRRVAAAVIDSLPISQVGTGRLGTEPEPNYSGWYLSANTTHDPECRWVPVYTLGALGGRAVPQETELNGREGSGE